MTMTVTRWAQLMDNEELNLTEQEIDEGWHFCFEFDGLLVGPGMEEQKFCRCEIENQEGGDASG